jgi:AAA domain
VDAVGRVSGMNWERLNLAAPEFEKPSEPPTLCGLIYRGRRHLVSGPPEAMKTMFALIVGLELLRTTDDTFALIDFESGPHATRAMLTDLGATLEEIKRVYYVEPDTPPTRENIFELLDGQVSLAIIDAVVGAYGISGLDDNARKDAETFGAAWVDPLWRAGVTTLLIDHVAKNSESRGKFAIGSERKAGRTDVHLGLEAKVQLSRGKTGVVVVATHKDRPGWLPRPRAAELELRSDPDTHALTWTLTPAVDTGDEFRPTYLMEQVSRFVERQAEAVSRKEIEDNIHGRRQYVRDAIDALIADGYATEDKGPRGARLVELLKPYLATSPDLAPTSPGRSETTSPLAPPLSGGEDEVDNRLSFADLARGEVSTLDDEAIAALGKLPLTTLAAMHERGEL